MERHLKIIGHLFFLVFLIFSVLFSYERVLFVDSAYQFFKIVNFETFNVEASRFPAVFTQLITLAGVKMHIPMEWLIVCFSVSFVIVYYIVFLLSVYVFRNVAAGIAITLVLCLSARHSFFHVATETHQALVYSCLFFAWIMVQSGTNFFGNWQRLPNLIVGVVIVGLAGYSHPVAYVAILFCILYFMIDKNDFNNSLAYTMFAVTILMGAFKYFTTPSATYEGQFLSQIVRADELLLNHSHLFSKWFYDSFYKEMYRLPFWMIVTVSVYYLFNSRFLKFLFIPTFYFGFILFAQIVFNANDSRLMMERAFLPLSFFAAIPFLNDLILKKGRLKNVKITVVALLLVFSMGGIYKTSSYFSNRITYMDQLFEHMDDKPSHKLLIDWENTTHDLVYIPWAFGVETLIYSVTKKGEQKTVFVHDKIDELNLQLDDKNLFLCVHFDTIRNSSQLNSKYFVLPNESYVVEREAILFNELNE